MIKQLFFLLSLLFAVGLYGQSVPQKFTYQAIARDDNGQVLTNENLNISIVILDENMSEIYLETNQYTTNSYGLFTVYIGQQNPNEFKGISWGTGTHHIQVMLDGTIIGTTPILSVPYAIVAQTALDDGDRDPTNEIQDLSFDATTNSLKLTNSEAAIELVKIQGSEGQPGLQGPTGRQGPPGIPGQEGAKGPLGPQGPEGISGPRGVPGPAGEVIVIMGNNDTIYLQGPQGFQGETGRQGLQGISGPQGPQGISGPQGLQGIEGQAGLSGPRGETGPRGISGSKGDKGDTGEAGPAGGAPRLSGSSAYEIWQNKGNSGTETDFLNSLIGPRGFKGDTGAQGLAGAIGNKGDTGAIGATGSQGAAGANGAKGDTGAVGIACWDLNANGTLDANEDTNGDGFGNGKDCQGATGAKGDTGSQGIPGLRSVQKAELLIPAWDEVQVSNLGKFQDDILGTVSWTIDTLSAPEEGNHTGMIITYRFNDLNQINLAPIVQVVNRYTDRSRSLVNFSINILKSTSNSLTVSIVRMDKESVWSDTFSFLYILLF